MQLKQENGAHIMKYGVTALDRALLDNKLVDETICGSRRPASIGAKELSPTSRPTSSISSCSERTGLRTGSWPSHTVRARACPAKVGTGFAKKDMLKQKARAG